MHPLRSDAPLIVYLDIKSPYAFVAYRPTLRLEAELGLRFDWRPLTLDIPSYLGSAQKRDGKVVTASGRGERLWRAIRYGYADARRYAERQGLVLKGTEKIWDSSIAGIGILWVMERAPQRIGAYLHAVYPRFWRRELDIEDVSLVAQCLANARVPTAGFREFQAGAGRERHDALQGALHPAGLYGVPTFVRDGVPFMGREHLPYLRWHLAGKRGPAPDIAYEIA